MGLNNKQLIEKAVVTTDAIASSGKLNPDQANKFIDYVFDVTGLKNKVRQVRMKADQSDLNKINVGNRVAVPKAEAVDPGTRRGVSTTKISMTQTPIMVPFEISDEFDMFNIEEDAIEDHIIKMMATALGNDLEEMYIDGDTLGPARFQADINAGTSTTQAVKDTYMELHNGWLKRARSGNVVDFEGANISSSVFSQMINALPEKYKRNKTNLKFFGSTNMEQNYRQVVGSRATSKGDAAISSEVAITPFGIEYVPVPLISSTPRVTEEFTLTGLGVQTLAFENIVDGSEIVVLDTLGATPVTPYVEGVDYTMDYVNGTIVRLGGGSIASPSDIKMTYQSESQLMLTEYRNLIVGIGADIKIEKDRDIYKSVDQYAITARVTVQIENLEALVWGKNIGLN